MEEVWTVYENLFKLAEGRGVKVTTTPIDRKRFFEYIVHHGYISVAGSRGADDPRGGAASLFVLAAPISDAGKRKRDLYHVLPKEVKERTEILVFTAEAPTKNVLKAAASYHSENKIARLFMYDYGMCIVDVRAHVLVSPHTIVPQEEFDLMKDKYFIDAVELPRIHHDDPQAVWLGVHRGMVIVEERYTETAGIMIVYMVVV